MQTRLIRIGSRGSRLALVQAGEARDRLIAVHGLSPEEVEIVTITTTGDRIRDQPLAEIGGKALFAKEIEEALLGGEIDLAVHSMKDMPGDATLGLAIPSFLPREDPRDAFMSRVATDVMALPQGAVLGSSSVRRIAQLKHLRPDLVAVPFRGNVETRLARLGRGEADATVLACAGLKRLGLGHEITLAMPPDIMLPAVAQGAIGLQVRQDDERMHALIAPLNDAATAWQMAAERAFLIVLEGSCRTPLAGHAVLNGDRIAFRGMALLLDGSEVFEARREGESLTWEPYPGVPAVSALADGDYLPDPQWYRGFQYDEERERGHRGHAGIRLPDQSFPVAPDIELEVGVGVMERVGVPAREEGAHHEGAAAVAAGPAPANRHHRHAVWHEQFLLHGRAVSKAPAPGGPGLVREPLRHGPVLRSDDARCVPLSRQILGRLSRPLDPGVEAVDQHHTSGRRRGGRQQQRVVAPGADPRRGPRGEASEAVRLQPLGAVVDRDRGAHRGLTARRGDFRWVDGVAPCSRRRAMSSRQRTASAVHPVWWLAPTPRPFSPSKYS